MVTKTPCISPGNLLKHPVYLLFISYLFAGEYRGAQRQGEYPAAGLHLPAQAGGVCSHGGYGVRHTVSG